MKKWTKWISLLLRLALLALGTAACTDKDGGSTDKGGTSQTSGTSNGSTNGSSGGNSNGSSGGDNEFGIGDLF